MGDPSWVDLLIDGKTDGMVVLVFPSFHDAAYFTDFAGEYLEVIPIRQKN
jgi:hypothetical protein